MISLRRALAARGVRGCPAGLRSVNRFYAEHPAEQAFGFHTVRDVTEALRWPRAYQPVDDHPDDDGQDWQNNLQGIAQDGTSWFLVRRDVLQVVPVGVDLQDLGSYHFENRAFRQPLGADQEYTFGSEGICRIKAPVGYNHLGALTIHRSAAGVFLYIPVQDNDGPNPPIVYAVEVDRGRAIIDHDWRAVISGDTATGSDQGAWCAADPVTGLLYTSDFYGSRPGSAVSVYRVGSASDPRAGHPVPGQPMRLSFLGSMTLYEEDGRTPARLARVQGGVITPRRHLYLALDDGTGLVGYDLVTGRRSAQIPVLYDRNKKLGRSQELEGLCVYSDPPASSNLPGDLHLILWQNGGGPVGQDFWLKNYAVAADDRPFL